MKKIYKLSDLNWDEEQKKLIESAIINSGIYKKPNKEFDEYGLRYDINYLNKIEDAIIILPLEYMAHYVDIITKTHIDENDTGWISEQMKVETFELKKANATGLGNIAYTALNCRNEAAKNHSMEYLEKYFDFFLSKFSNDRKYGTAFKIIHKFLTNNSDSNQNDKQTS